MLTLFHPQHAANMLHATHSAPIENTNSDVSSMTNELFHEFLAFKRSQETKSISEPIQTPIVATAYPILQIYLHQLLQTYPPSLLIFQIIPITQYLSTMNQVILQEEDLKELQGHLPTLIYITMPYHLLILPQFLLQTAHLEHQNIPLHHTY
ncbi:hypothetical protein STAS_12060, partial [Striga asiatica]